MKNKILHLNLKSCWYDLIEQGIKTEEYREIKPYWVNRLCEKNNNLKRDLDYLIKNKATIEHQIEVIEDYDFKQYDAVQFTYGYTKRNMLFECKGIEIGTGKPQLGAEKGQKYFVIKLGYRIN